MKDTTPGADTIIINQWPFFAHHFALTLFDN